MHLIRTSIFLVLALFLLLSGTPECARAALLATPPLGERWFGIAMGDERTGYAHTAIAVVPEGYEVSSEGCARMVVLGFTREAFSRETYRVDSDLSLKSFAVEQTIGGTPTRLRGEITAKGIKVAVVDAAGKGVEKTLKVRGKVYSSALLNLYPLMHGVSPGKKYRIKMFDPEEVKLKEVTITVVGRETLGGTETVHLRNDLYPFVDNDIWVDLSGNTVRESVRDGLIVTGVEEAAAAQALLGEAAVVRKEYVVGYSLVRPDRPLARPADLKRMAVELSGVPTGKPLFSDGGQKAVRLEGEKVLVTTEKGNLPVSDGTAAAGVSEVTAPIGPAGANTAEESELATALNGILGGERRAQLVVEKLVSWVAAEVAESGDNGSPRETFRSRKGNSLSRTRLYGALAKAAGVPTRLVTGLVYVTGKGFLYHCWAESRLGGWVPVDPCRGEVPADATHIKLAEGDTPEAMATLAGLIGRVRARVVEETY